MKSKTRSYAQSAFLLAVVTLLVTQQHFLWSQTTQTVLTGIVRDPSGGIVVAAQVKVTNIETNVSRSDATNAEGSYSFSNLPPGTYRVTVEAVGFKKYEQSNVRVLVGSPTVVDCALAVGEVTETLSVSDETVPLTVTSADRGTVIETKVILDLPLQGAGNSTSFTSARQLESFLSLTPGVTLDPGGQPRFNGGSNFMHDYYLDGIPYLFGDEGGNFATYRPPYESIDQFRVTTNTYSSQFGRGTGSANFNFKSGTNNIHGTFYESLRNNSLNARGFFSPTRPTNQQNEYGFSVGGPVFVPKVYDGRARTFFHFTFGGYRKRGGTRTSLLTLPTQAMLRGDFSQLRDASGNVIPIFDPATNRPDGQGGITRDQFPGNIIPTNRFSTVSKALLPLMTPAQTDASVNNFLSGLPIAPFNQDDWALKIDHTFNSKIGLHTSLVRSNQITLGAQTFGGELDSGGREYESLAWMYRMTFDVIFSPSLLMTVGSSYQRMWVPDQSGIVPINSSIHSEVTPIGQTYPGLGFSGQIVGMGIGNTPAGAVVPGASVNPNLNWTRGRHIVSVGGDFRWENERRTLDSAFPGNFNFARSQTSLPNSPNFGSWGHSFASFLLGVPNSVFRQSQLGARRFYTQYNAVYIQDDFRVTPNLTLNLGLRWDVPRPAYEQFDRLAFLDPSLPNPAAGGRPGALVFAGSEGSNAVGRRRYADTEFTEFQPRLGFAYRLTNRTTVRGGYGLNYLRTGNLTMWGPAFSSFYAVGFRATQALQSLDGGISPAAQWDTGVPPIVIPPRSLTSGNGSTVEYMGRDAGQAGSFQNWSLTVERELPWQTALEISYAGSKSNGIGSNLENLNQVDPKYLSLGNLLQRNILSPEAVAAGIQVPYPGFSGTVAQALRPYPQFAGISSNAQSLGNATYHALQLRAQRYFSQGITFLVSYTASKSITDSNSSFAPFGGAGIDNYNRKAEKGLCNCDVPRNLVISGVYELPIGPDKRFLKKAGASGKILGGWQVSYITNYRSGVPLGIAGGSPLPIFNAGFGSSGNRPNMIAASDPLISRGGGFDPAKDIYLNAAAFAQPAPFTIGNAPRLLNARTFPFYNEDITILKRTAITEDKAIEFRVDFFNAFNRVVFAAPNGDFNNLAAFGKVSGQANIPRNIQLGLRFNF